MSEKSTVNLMVVQKNIQECLKKPQAKEACLACEYKLILLYSSQFGIYIMPQLDTIQVWHGVLFIRFGLFKDAKFKFRIHFDQFPRRAPRVNFVSEIYHPLVNAETGELDLGEDMNKNWNYPNEHLIFSVIEYIRLIFIDVKKYEVNDSLNRKAGQLFKSNVDQFFIRVRECVQTSKNQIYNNYPQTSLKFLPFTERHRKIKQQLSQIVEQQNLSQEQKKRKFMRILKQ